MNIEQHIVRWLFAVPMLLLALLFLPYQGGGYQFLGIMDREFLLSGALVYARLVVEIVLVVGVALGLDQLVKAKSAYR
ncbi:MAG TPA: hypothetical protein VGM23_02280 [Armatimonadota bacterium]